MKKALLILMAFVIPTALWAYSPWEYTLVVEYSYTNLNAKSPINFVFKFDNDSLVLDYWYLPAPKPTMEEINVLMATKLEEAKIWNSNETVKATADIEKMDRQVKIWFKALLKLHNERCPSGERFNMDELKAKVDELATREK